MEEIFNPTKDTILEGFNIDLEHQKELAQEYFVGNSATILDRICNQDTLTKQEKCSLLIEFGSRLVLDYYADVADAHAEWLKKTFTH